MSQNSCPTVRVFMQSAVNDANPDGVVIINESDLTPEYILFDKPVVTIAPAVSLPVQPVAMEAAIIPPVAEPMLASPWLTPAQ
jgi:hypothetical protein